MDRSARRHAAVRRLYPHAAESRARSALRRAREHVRRLPAPAATTSPSAVRYPPHQMTADTATGIRILTALRHRTRRVSRGVGAPGLCGAEAPVARTRQQWRAIIEWRHQWCKKEKPIHGGVALSPAPLLAAAVRVSAWSPDAVRRGRSLVTRPPAGADPSRLRPTATGTSPASSQPGLLAPRPSGLRSHGAASEAVAGWARMEHGATDVVPASKAREIAVVEVLQHWRNHAARHEGLLRG
jgi:hypothetical protein